MTKTCSKTTLVTLTGTFFLMLAGCQSPQHTTTVPGAVRGQDIQPGQQEEVPMSRAEAEAQMQEAQAGQIGSNTEVAGKPDVATQQGALPPGVGYDNNPGELYNPAMGQRHYVHHYVHHIYHNGSSAIANANTPPPTGYSRGAYVVPDNEDPNDRGDTAGGLMGAYNLPIQHTYHAPVTQHYYGGYPNNNQGSGVPSGFFGYGSDSSGGTTWGKFGQWHPNALDGAGTIGGFTD